ncbi:MULTISPECIES: carbohydrate ABC transporter permease [unclassified Paenibacillus]|uniref:carbohydrate ABC transporter permease n=1 Tax=unclassified Paenibacillus TaxID=185978 RepID=UPI002F406DBF
MMNGAQGNLAGKLNGKAAGAGAEGWLARLILYVLIGLGALVSVFPFYWILVIASRTRDAVYHIPPVVTLGDQISNNFNNVLAKITFFRALWNSFFVSGASTICVLLLCSLAGLAFAKYNFPGKKWLFAIVLGTLLIPTQLNILPNYVVMSKLSWIDSHKAIIVPGMVTAFGIFWMRQYISSAVHNELMEAGRVDGCSHFRIFWNIVLPIITPGLATLGIFNFLNVWNDFFWPLVVLKNKMNFTIQIAMQQLYTINDGIDYGTIMSAIFFSTLPLLIVFILFSRWFIAGISTGAVKS